MIVYQHKKADTGEIFYVGIGEDSRPYNFTQRNKLWKNIANKHGVKVEIVSENCTKEEAQQIEQYLIAYYGRICLNTGCLANITDGGENRKGAKASQDTKNKISKKLKNRSYKKSTLNKMSKAKIGQQYTCKLTSKQVKYIKENYMFRSKEWGAPALGKKFNVDKGTILNIINNKTYSHV